MLTPSLLPSLAHHGKHWHPTVVDAFDAFAAANSLNNNS